MKRSLIYVYLTVFIDLLSLGIILPSLPSHAMKSGAGGIVLWLLMAGYPLLQMVGAPLWGRWSDRFGRKPVLLICLASSSASLVLTGMASGLRLLLAARVLAGFFGGSLGVAQAMVADATLPEERARHLGYLGAVVGLGFLLSPALGLFFAGQGFSAAAFIGALLALFNFMAASFFLRETFEKRSVDSALPAADIENPSRARAGAGSGRFIVSLFLTTAGLVAMETALAPMAKDGLGLRDRDFGILLSFTGAVVVLVQGVMLGPLVKKFGEIRLARAGAVMGGLGLGLVSLAATQGAYSLTLELLGLLALGYALANPALTSLLSRSSSRESQGEMMGLGQATASLARATVPLAAAAALGLSPHLPFILAALAMLAAWAVLAGKREADASSLGAE